MYMPQRMHPAYGVARAYVRDGNDNYTGPASEGFVDSGEPLRWVLAVLLRGCDLGWDWHRQLHAAESQRNF